MNTNKNPNKKPTKKPVAVTGMPVPKNPRTKVLAFLMKKPKAKTPKSK